MLVPSKLGKVSCPSSYGITENHVTQRVAKTSEAKSTVLRPDLTGEGTSRTSSVGLSGYNGSCCYYVHVASCHDLSERRQEHRIIPKSIVSKQIWQMNGHDNGAMLKLHCTASSTGCNNTIATAACLFCERGRGLF